MRVAVFSDTHGNVVGLRFDGKAAFTLIDRLNDRWIVTQHLADYDREEEMRLMRARGAPEPLYHLLRRPG